MHTALVQRLLHDRSAGGLAHRYEETVETAPAKQSQRAGALQVSPA